MSTKAQKRRAEMAKQAYGTVTDMGLVLRSARLASGLKAGYIAKCMDVSTSEWLEYERNRNPIPGHIIIKLMIFGMDFWARNKSCFENTTTDTQSADADTTSTRGELGLQTNI